MRALGLFAFKLNLRDLVEMMAERGLSLAHTTIMRWVWRYAPEFEKRWKRFAQAVGRSWRVDETYIKIRGENGAISIVPWIGEAIGKSVARVTHHFAGLADIAELPGQLQQPYLGAEDDLLFLGHRRCPFETPRPGAANPDHSAPSPWLSPQR